VQPCFALGFVVNGTVTLEEIGSTGVFVPVAAPEDIVYVAEFTLKN
jgi:hypothetical protein